MNPIEIATTVIAILSPYLLKAGEEIAKNTGDAAWKKADELLKAVKARVRKEKESFPAQTLEQYEKNPEKRKGAMQDVLVEILEKDARFRKSLTALLIEAEKAGTGTVFNVQIFGGKVDTMINADKIEGGLRIQKR